MSVEATTATSEADPQAFFSISLEGPNALLEARQTYLAVPDLAKKFATLAAEARSSSDDAIYAAAASWVNGDYARIPDILPEADDDLTRFMLASSLLELGHATKAAELLKGVVGDPVTGRTYLLALDVSGQIEELGDALEQTPLSDHDRIFFTARLQELAGEYGAAVGAYEQLLAEDDDHVDARFRLACRLDLLGDDQGALAHYEQLAARRPVGCAVLMNLGLLYEDLGEYEKACGCFGAILRRDPTNARAKLFWTDARESLDMYYDEDLERLEDELMHVLRTPISDFELSVRARNCLSNMEIRTLGDLVAHSEQELLEFKNFGETSLNEIKHILGDKGLRLGIRRDDGTYLIPEEFGSANAESSEETFDHLPDLTDDQRAALDQQISALNLSVRCHRALVERLGLQRVGDILRHSEEELLSMPNFGITSLNELKQKLGEFDLTLSTGRGEEYAGGEELVYEPSPEEPGSYDD